LKSIIGASGLLGYEAWSFKLTSSRWWYYILM